MKGIPSGTVFEGKWTRRSFTVAKCLGEGANGAVYLVHTPDGYAAMKICEQAADTALEWNVLEQVSQLRTSFPRPIVIDDAIVGKSTFYFYIMEWVPGEPLDKVMRKLDVAAYQEVVRQIALGLKTLHQAGMAFCDIKPQNILVATDGPVSVRFVDVGGVTAFGRSVRQFTPISDRAFWELGTRRAEPSYDICGLCLSLVLLEQGPLPKSLYQMPPGDRQRWLKKTLRRYPYGSLAQVLDSGLNGKLGEADSFLASWQSMSARTGKTKASFTRKSPPPRSRPVQNNQGSSGVHHYRKGPTRQNVGGGKASSAGRHAAPRRVDWTEWLMWGSLTMAAFVTSMAWAQMLGWSP